jgi:hypothetical protein
MTDRRKRSIGRRLSRIAKDTQVKLAAEYFALWRVDALQDDWWQFLEKKIARLDRQSGFGHFFQRKEPLWGESPQPCDIWE